MRLFKPLPFPSGPRVFAILVLALATGGISCHEPLAAQEGELVDRIAAVVGDSVITVSQVQERLVQLQAQGAEISSHPDSLAELRQEILDNMIGEQLILQAALRDSTIVVQEGELDEIVEEDIRQRASSFGGSAQLQEALEQQHWTLGTYREFLRANARQQRLYNQFLAKHSRDVGSVEVSEAEMREFFEEQRGSMTDRPPEVSFIQVIVDATPSDSAVAEARAEAERIRQLALEGEEEFEELARRYSQDPGSRESGGDLGWFRRGDMVPAFEETAFRLGAGQVSEPVQTPFGFHIIKVERRRTSEVKARHILIQASSSEGDVERHRERAVEVKERMEAGEDFQTLRQEFGHLDSPDSLTVPFNQLRNLPPGFAEPLLQAEPDDVIGPIRYEAQGRTRFAVLRVEDVREGGEFDFEDVRAQIRQRLQERRLMERIVDDLRQKTYVEVRMGRG